MKQFLLAVCFVLVCSAASAQAPTTNQARASSNAGAKRWVFWQNLNNVQTGLARETGRTVARSTATTSSRRRGIRRRR